jgi:hypothetical protein
LLVVVNNSNTEKKWANNQQNKKELDLMTLSPKNPYNSI